MEALTAAELQFETVGDGVYAVDSGYMGDGIDAIHIVRAGSSAYIVDTGTAASVPRVLSALEALHIPRTMVTHVVLTHPPRSCWRCGRAAGGVADAALVVHPRGARHMVDPTRLVAGSVAVYGEQVFRELYGEITLSSLHGWCRPPTMERLRSATGTSVSTHARTCKAPSLHCR